MKPPLFHTVLIANRGEIAARLLSTVQRMGYRGIAVYSDADADMPYLRAADGACRIGPGPARDSYVNFSALLRAAHGSGADALHPGYGFLAENPDFAQAVIDAGLVWIGPPPSAMRAMGNKASAKRLLAARDVPLLPGFQDAPQDGQDRPDQDRDAAMLRAAERIGLPIMVKAAAGGGGRGMRLVTESTDLPSALARARSESLAAFGSGELILERALFAPRHIEVQIFADSLGNLVHLGERDCSVQRRHQKLIEETPSPAVDPALRARLGAAAIEVARSCGYVGAGTVEFLLDQDRQFWFMEMNTRLQVEHAVTEALTGLDLVEWQLRVAQGEALPLDQAQIDARLAGGGHAIEVRLCAEDPAQDFLPQSGTLGVWRCPPLLRTDHALASGQEISPYYDSMLAKMIGHEGRGGHAGREAARRKLVRGLSETVILGLPSNQDFLLDCLQHPEFIAGRATTNFIAENFPDRQRGAPSAAEFAVAAGLTLILAAKQANAKALAYPPELAGWSSNGVQQQSLPINVDGVARVLDANQTAAGRWQIRLPADMPTNTPDNTLELALVQLDGLDCQLKLGDVQHKIAYWQDKQKLYLRHNGRNHTVVNLSSQRARTQAGAVNAVNAVNDGRIKSPMNGKVLAVHCADGQTVVAGQALIVLEAMKMEHGLSAPCNGSIRIVHCAPGQQVAPGMVLLEIDPDKA